MTESAEFKWPVGQPPPAKRVRWRLVAALVAGGALLFAAGWYGGVTYAGRGDPPAGSNNSVATMARAQTTCDNLHHGTAVADGGHTLTVDTRGDEDAGGTSVEELSCVLDSLGTPEAVRTHMDETRALDGRQQDSWGPFTASWIYHPDSGLELIVRAA